jgi:hypothetical protein
MKKKFPLLVYTVLFLISSVYGQVVTEGVSFDESFKVGNKNLVLNGTGVREKHRIDLYVAGLYIPKVTNDAATIVKANETAAMKIVIVSKMITKSKMDESIREGFQKSTQGNSTAFQDRIDKFVKALSEDIGKGAIYMLVYDAEKETLNVYKDNQLKTEIKGLDFKIAVFGIWLGEDPVDDDLKNKLLKR